MGNVDGVPVASQIKSVVQVSRGDVDGALETQSRFTQRCIGAAQVRSLLELARGDVNEAGETQRRFLENTRSLLGDSEVADAVPLVAQLKSIALVADGDASGAVTTQNNFTRHCPIVAQVRSAVEVVSGDSRAAVNTQREFFEFSSHALDKVPLLGHAKSFVHRTLGEDARADSAMRSANASSLRGCQLLGGAVSDIFSGVNNAPRGGSSSSASAPSANSVSAAELHANAPALDSKSIAEHTLAFVITNDQVQSHGACPICMSDFCVGEPGTTLRCFHVFHARCCEQWLRRSGNCPVCRVAVAPTPRESA
eukprot:TRINITY_DN55415_c0_g1_i1.p1 TRINITY_DN55415_c0_g1~~TRINITY_DN55415_c0_g1_i1.p1  ORF type:complete len:310 (+),score=53.92 TRINITY_DN55415_c0_g1_i1:159-1088(+)